MKGLFNSTKKLLSIYTIAGHPELEVTLPVLKSLQDSGVDFIELGMPYSDPLADGPIIQEGALRAINNGMTLKVLFTQLKDLRPTIHIPVLLMGYVNTVMQYGVEQFCKDCKACGINGVILPDLPYQEYVNEYQKLFQSYGLLNVFLVTPQTTPERVKLLDKATEGFLYLVSTASTTGNNKGILAAAPYLERLQALKLQSNTIVGFNIKDKSTFDFACNYADGAIIGSAFVQLLSTTPTDKLEETIHSFIRGIRA